MNLLSSGVELNWLYKETGNWKTSENIKFKTITFEVKIAKVESDREIKLLNLEKSPFWMM